MPSRRDFLAMVPAAALGPAALMPTVVQTQAGPAVSGAQAINASVFRGERIRSVTAITEVFGRSQRSTAVGCRTPRITGLTRKQCRYPLKLIITQPHTYHPDSAQKSGYDHKSRSVNRPLVTP